MSATSNAPEGLSRSTALRVLETVQAPPSPMPSANTTRATGTRRASRGGAWRHQIKIARCAARSSIPPEFCDADFGFRVACEVIRAGSS